MNSQNLKPIRTTEEARKKGKAGGIASGISRHKKIGFKQLIREIAKTQLIDETQKKKLTDYGLDTDIRDYVFYELLQSATKKHNITAQIKLLELFTTYDEEPLDDFNNIF